MQVLSLVLEGSTDSSVAEPIFVLFFGDNHGEEAVSSLFSQRILVDLEL